MRANTWVRPYVVMMVALALVLGLVGCPAGPTGTPEPTASPWESASPSPWETMWLPPGVPSPSDWGTLFPTVTPTRGYATGTVGAGVRSWKKGVAGPGGLRVADLGGYLNAVEASWYHNWHYSGESFGTEIEYVRNVRSIHTAFSVEDVENAPAGSTWFVGNEPGDEWQDNLKPMQAAEKYGEIIFRIKGADPGARIVVGGWKNPSLYLLTNYLAQFESAFVTKWNVDIRSLIVGWHLHAYVHPYYHLGESTKDAVQRVQRQVRHWIKVNPGMDLWITEYGNLNRADAYIMTEMTNFFENEPGVTRYAFYHFGNRTHHPETALYGEPWPMMTELGECYAGLPAQPAVTSTATATRTKTPRATATYTPTSSPTGTTVATPIWPTCTMFPTPVALPRAIIDACLAANGKPIVLNREAALWKAARQMYEGCPLSPEVRVEFGGETYVAQRYLFGYLWARDGDWENIYYMTHLGWEVHLLGPCLNYLMPMPTLTPTPDGSSAQVMEMEVTAYTDHDAGMRGDGIMASGEKTFVGAAAAGPSVPFGTKLYVPDWGVVTVLDRGSGIHDDNLDLYMPEREDALRWGRRRLRVTVLYVPGKEERRLW